MSVQRNDLNILLRILCLIWPLGLLFFILMKKQQPNASKQALNMALIGFGISMVLIIVFSLLAS